VYGEVYGEVFDPSEDPTTQMGDGKFGTETKATKEQALSTSSPKTSG
jgi:hypothetical protein